MTTTARARQIAHEMGCDWRTAVSRASRELDGDGPPRHLSRAATHWAEVLSEIHPDHEFVAAVKPATVELERVA